MLKIGWINFTKDDHARVAGVLDLLKETGSVDELGIGRVRDAIADRLFPGLSTIQTRPKYFFTVAYILKDFIKGNYENRKINSAKAYLEGREDELMRVLNKIYKEGDGVIGISLTGPNQTLSRRPSEIYWSGMRTFNFVKTPHSRSQYLKLLNKYIGQESGSSKTEEDKDDAENNYNSFGLKISSVYNEEWRKEEDQIQLNESEAKFLIDRLRDHKDTLLKVFAENRDIYEDFRRKDTEDAFSTGAKRILAKYPDAIPVEVTGLLKLAVNFSALLFGTYCAYNFRIQDIKGGADKDQYELMWNDFITTFRDEMIDPAHFSIESLYNELGLTKNPTYTFLNQYYNEINSSSPSLEKVVELVKSQERRLKGNRARLSNGQVAEIEAEKQYGIISLNYRYSTVDNLFKDLFNPRKNA